MSGDKNVSRRISGKNVRKEEKSADTKTTKDTAEKDFKYGPLPKFPGQRVWSRGIMILGVLIYIWYFSKQPTESVFARQDEAYDRRGQNVDCSKEYLADIKKFPGCLPRSCGRYVSDKIVTSYEATTLLNLAYRVMAFGGSSGGATIMDLHSGALSYKDKFINVYAQKKDKHLLTPTDKAVYHLVRKKIQNAIADSFGIDVNSLHLTHPTFFSRLSNVPAKTLHDEYWHAHIDKHTYEGFHYTSLLYLNNYGIDFIGGRFVFMDNIHKPTKNSSVEPRTGRVSMFTSGSENPHFVEPVTDGLRYAVTVSFTCDPSLAIEDPLTR